MKFNKPSQKTLLQVSLYHNVFDPKILDLVKLINDFPDDFNPIPGIKNPPAEQKADVPIVTLWAKGENDDEKTGAISFFYNRIILATYYKHWKLDFIYKIISKILEINGADFKINKVSVQINDLFDYPDNPVKEFYQHLGLKQNICKEEALHDVSFALRYTLPHDKQDVLMNFEAMTCAAGAGKSVDEAPDSITVYQTAKWKCTDNNKVNDFIKFAWQTREEKLKSF